LIILEKPQNASLDVHPSTTYCEGRNITLVANSIGGARWKFLLNGDSLIDRGRNEYGLLGSQLSEIDSVQAIIFTTDGCTDTLSEVLTAIPRPELLVLDSSININVVGLASASLFLDASLPNSMLYWSAKGYFAFEGDSIALPATIKFDTLIPNVTDPFSITFQLAAKASGCSGGRIVTLQAIEQSGFFIPEVITPDGNGMNDTWMVTWKDGIDPALYRIQLFNGAGGKVYEMNGLHQNFDGGNLPDGVYWWTLLAMNGESVQSGGLTVRRK
jgi:hypothetical protein